jgi:hypothetical protein
MNSSRPVLFVGRHSIGRTGARQLRKTARSAGRRCGIGLRTGWACALATAAHEKAPGITRGFFVDWSAIS